MYCDPILWKNVRDYVLERGKSRREAALKFRMSRNTVRRMLQNEMPPRGLKRKCHRPVIGPHEATIRRMMEERSISGYSYSPRIKEIFEYISKKKITAGVIQQSAIMQSC